MHQRRVGPADRCCKVEESWALDRKVQIFLADEQQEPAAKHESE